MLPAFVLPFGEDESGSRRRRGVLLPRLQPPPIACSKHPACPIAWTQHPDRHQASTVPCDTCRPLDVTSPGHWQFPATACDICRPGDYYRCVRVWSGEGCHSAACWSPYLEIICPGVVWHQSCPMLNPHTPISWSHHFGAGACSKLDFQMHAKFTLNARSRDHHRWSYKVNMALAVH